jgi:hypothetical protein
MRKNCQFCPEQNLICLLIPLVPPMIFIFLFSVKISFFYVKCAKHPDYLNYTCFKNKIGFKSMWDLVIIQCTSLFVSFDLVLSKERSVSPEYVFPTVKQSYCTILELFELTELFRKKLLH